MNRIVLWATAAALGLGGLSAQTRDAGKRQYEERCTGCHGADGSGGGHGPAIVGLAQPRAASESAVRDVILKGIADRGMPAFQVSAGEASALAAYVISLRTGPAAAACRAAVTRPRRCRRGRALLRRQGQLRQLPHGARARRHSRPGPFRHRPRPPAGADRTGAARSGGGAGNRPRRARRTGRPRRGCLSRRHRAACAAARPFAASPKTKARSTCNCSAPMASCTC